MAKNYDITSRLEPRDKVKLALSNGRGIEFLPIITKDMVLEYSDIDDRSFSDEEKFRKLIQKSNLLDGVEDDSYEELKSSDLQIIANYLVTSENPNYSNINSANVYEEFFLRIEEAISDIEKLYKKFNEIYGDSIKDIETPISTIIKMFENFGTFAIRFSDKINYLNEEINNMLTVTVKWSEDLEIFLRNYKEQVSVEEEAVLIAAKYGLFLFENPYLTSNFYEEIVSLKNNGEESEIVPFVLETFNHEVRTEIFKDMRSLEVVKRYSIVVDEIQKGIEHKLYLLTAPLIYSFIEGLIADKFNHQGRLNGDGMKQYLNELINKTRVLNKKVQKGSKKLLKYVFYANFEHGKDIKSLISRHVVVHGGSFAHGTERGITSLFLFLVSVVYMVELYNE